MTAVLSILRRLLASDKLSLILTGTVVLCATTSSDSAIALSNGNYTWLLALLSPFFFVLYDFKKLIRLGASKRDYYLGALLGYIVLAATISLVNTGIHLLIDPLNQTQTVVNLMEVCGWTQNSILAAFFQQMVFLLLVMVFLHLLLSVQSHWYGWAADAALIAVICVFTPIPSLRRILTGFFGMVMLNQNAALHITLCLLLSGALAAAGLAVLKRKAL